MSGMERQYVCFCENIIALSYTWASGGVWPAMLYRTARIVPINNFCFEK